MKLSAIKGAPQTHVRFTPDSDRERETPQTVMSALPPKADALQWRCPHGQ
jgi:hypothetical protein